MFKIFIVLILLPNVVICCDEPVCTYERVTSMFGWLDSFNIDNLNKFTDRRQDFFDMATNFADIIPTFKTLIDGIDDSIKETLKDDIKDLYSQIPDQLIKMKKFVNLIIKMVEIDPTKIVNLFLSTHDSIKSCMFDRETSIDVETFFSSFLDLPEEVNIPFCLMEKLYDGLYDLIDIGFLSDRWSEFKSTFIATTNDMSLIRNVMIKFRGPKEEYDLDLIDCTEVNEFKMKLTQQSVKTIGQMAKLYIETLKSIFESLSSIAEGLADSTDVKLKSFPDVGGVLAEIKTPTNWWSIGKGLMKPLDMVPELFDYVNELVETAIGTVCKTSDILFIEDKANLRDKLHLMTNDYLEIKGNLHVVIDDYIEIKDDLHAMINDYNGIKDNLHAMIDDYLLHKNNKTLMENTYLINLPNQTTMINNFVNNLYNNTIMINDYVSFKNNTHDAINGYLCNHVNFSRTVDDYVNHNRLYILNPKPENGFNICLRRP